MGRARTLLVVVTLGSGCAADPPDGGDPEAPIVVAALALASNADAGRSPSSAHMLVQGAGFHAPVRDRSPSSPPVGVGSSAGSDAGTAVLRCREQSPQEFLLRSGQLANPRASAVERRQIEGARERSIDYRTRHYGKFPGFGHHRDNPYPPRHYARLAHFMGLPVLVHQKVAPALGCVQDALLRDCANTPYRPTHLGGLRERNTYADYEVSSHVYGIAIDIDPDRNPCCGCLGRWSQHASCRRRAEPVWRRMAMPECWVRVFERYGFRWLGHDELEDTMHFEFLGDPERILEAGGAE